MTEGIELELLGPASSAVQAAGIPLIVYIALKMQETMARFDAKLDTLINYMNPTRRKP